MVVVSQPPFPLKLLMEKMERAEDASGLTNIRYRPRRIQQTRAEERKRKNGPVAGGPRILSTRGVDDDGDKSDRA